MSRVCLLKVVHHRVQTNFASCVQHVSAEAALKTPAQPPHMMPLQQLDSICYQAT